MPGKEQSMRGSLFEVLGLSGFVSMTLSGSASLRRQPYPSAIHGDGMNGRLRLS
jgi:hypothetical protein